MTDAENIQKLHLEKRKERYTPSVAGLLQNDVEGNVLSWKLLKSIHC